VGALVMYFRPPVLLLSVVATLQPLLPRLKLLLSLLLFRDLQHCYCSSISCSAWWLNPGQGFSFLSKWNSQLSTFIGCLQSCYCYLFIHLSQASSVCSYISRKHRAFQLL
jgi:hypothetical protein